MMRCLPLVAVTVLAVAAEPKPVFVTASFTDRNNLFIENLTRDEVRITEDGNPREIEFMARDEVPTVYGIVFDRTLIPDHDAPHSTARNIPTSAREIAYELVDKGLSREAVWVGVYDRALEIALDVTSDGLRAKEAIGHLRPVERRRPEPNLYGALIEAVRRMSERPEKRRVLLVFLDSVDTDTGSKSRQIKNLLAGSNMEVFAVSFASRLQNPSWGLPAAMTQAFLKELAQAGSGDAFFTADYREHFDDITRRISSHTRTFYTFGYRSTSTPERPARLSIECARPGSKARHHPFALP